MENTKNQLFKFGMIILLIGFIGLLFSVSSVYAYYLHENRQMENHSNQCYVSPDQTVTKWKSAIFYWRRCRETVGGICIWPITRRHVTYKVTVNDGIPLRTEQGDVIPVFNGKEESSWLTFDAESWNAISEGRYKRYEFLDYEPIASNEYVVMVETRYGWFNDVESTLGICVQK